MDRWESRYFLINLKENGKAIFFTNYYMKFCYNMKVDNIHHPQMCIKGCVVLINLARYHAWKLDKIICH